MKMTTKDDCTAVLFYWPIVTRAESEIGAAVQKLSAYGGMMKVTPLNILPNNNFMQILLMLYNYCLQTKLLL